MLEKTAVSPPAGSGGGQRLSGSRAKTKSFNRRVSCAGGRQTWNKYDKQMVVWVLFSSVNTLSWCETVLTGGSQHNGWAALTSSWDWRGGCSNTCSALLNRAWCPLDWFTSCGCLTLWNAVISNWWLKNQRVSSMLKFLYCVSFPSTLCLFSLVKLAWKPISGFPPRPGAVKLPWILAQWPPTLVN